MLTVLLNTPVLTPQTSRLTVFAPNINRIFLANEKPDPFSGESVNRNFEASEKPQPIKAKEVNRSFRAKGGTEG